MNGAAAMLAALAAMTSFATVSDAKEQDPHIETSVCGSKQPPIPAYPEDLPAPPSEPSPYHPARGMGMELDLGIGAVGPADEPEMGADWVPAVELPLFDSPGGRVAGWIANGWWVHAATPPERLDTEGMVETGYETASWIALEESGGGWIRIRFESAAASGQDGSAWASVCHLSASDPPLAFRRWEERLGDLLFFRTRSAHALRAGPGITRVRRSWIRAEEDPMLERLDVRGDWMRVRVTRPSTYCVAEASVEPRVEEGWIRWWDEEMGPWVWYFTRGC
ncbi:MAG: hypothetical protein ACREK2_01025 [Gemmatimonadota bacterium]